MNARIIATVATLSLLTGSALGQAVHGESEYTIDPQGYNCFSQYLYLDNEYAGLTLHSFSVKRAGTQQFEAKVGPNLAFGKNLLLLIRAGFTSDGATTAGLVAIAGQGKFTYILDPKFYQDGPDTVFQKVELRLNQATTLRADHLLVGGDTAFLHLGVQLALSRPNSRAQLLVNPFYETKSRGLGTNLTVRF